MTLTQTAIILTLSACVLANKQDGRFYAAHCVLWVTVVHISIYNSSLYLPAKEFFGLHVYNSLYETALTLLLAFRAAKLAILLIGVCIAAIAVNALSYWVDLIGDSTLMFEVLMSGLFAVQVALLLSKRLTNGVYGRLEDTAGARMVHYASNYLSNSMDKSKGQTR